MYNPFKGLYSVFTRFVEMNRENLEFLDRYQTGLFQGKDELDILSEDPFINPRKSLVTKIEEDGPKRA